MFERDSARRVEIARWVLKKVASGVKCLAFGLTPSGIIDRLVDEEPLLLQEDGLTKLAKMRTEIERDRAKR